MVTEYLPSLGDAALCQPGPLPHRRVTFSTANQSQDLQDASQHSYYDSGLEESETPSSKSSSGPRIGPLALPEDHYERTTPDGSIGEMEHPENAPAAVPGGLRLRRGGVSRTDGRPVGEKVGGQCGAVTLGNESNESVEAAGELATGLICWVSVCIMGTNEQWLGYLADERGAGARISPLSVQEIDDERGERRAERSRRQTPPQIDEAAALSSFASVHSSSNTAAPKISTLSVQHVDVRKEEERTEEASEGEEERTEEASEGEEERTEEASEGEEERTEEASEGEKERTEEASEGEEEDRGGE
ncbi:hypothetical protein D9C73_006950 [Collichthys lucidus]|uniref:Uncharacterized protein n=1 Tax=Collichthys lucidus TaxID=240159 RepID=A0A4U5UED5_COLLU|nr:hypothetical protein D9C73_006950 [Collichthys lucidus]